MHTETLRRIAVSCKAIATDPEGSANSRAWGKARLEAAESILKERGAE